jgi:hypothetical protein
MDMSQWTKKTIKIWQPYSKAPLTDKDAEEITSNMVGFLSVLEEWNEKEQMRSNDERNSNLGNPDSASQTP